MSAKRRQRLVIVAVFAVFLTPVLFALLLNLPGVRWMPFGLRNHGELLQPPPSLDAVTPRVVAGDAPGEAQIAGTWTILALAPTPCDAGCEVALAELARLRIALGEHGGRTRLVWLVTEAPAEMAVETLVRKLPVLQVWATPRDSLPPVLQTDPTTLRVFVVDPRAYVILHYPAPVDARGLLKDLERLLRYAKDG